MPRPDGCGNVNPANWNKEPVDACDGLSSKYPQVHNDVIINTKLRIAS